MSARIVSLGSFKRGVTNRRQPTRLGDRDEAGAHVHWLLGADNVDLDDGGFLTRRRGVTRVVSGKAHSLWGAGQDMLAVVDDELVMVDASMQAHTLMGGMGPHPVSYTRAPDGCIYFTNGTVIQRLKGRAVEDLCPRPPAIVSAAVGQGALPAGRYHYTATMEQGGVESPAYTVQAVDVPEGASLTVTVQGVGTANVYVTAANGEVLSLAGANSSVQVTTPVLEGRECETLDTVNLPPGQIIRYYRSRLWVAAGSVLWFSNDYHYAICRPDRSYLTFPAPITVVEPTDGGLYICADKTYWLPDIAEGIRVVDDDGGIFGTSGQKGTDAYWHSAAGLVVGAPNGQIEKVQEAALMLTNAEQGASLYRKQDGTNHIVTTRRAPRENRVGVHSYIEAEIVRKGVNV